MKVLSLLLPAYNYPEGVENILKLVTSAAHEKIEIIIGDDSTNDAVKKIVEFFQAEYPRLISYRRNEPSLGAVFNWNSLLQLACGKYVMLLHHDEYPINIKYFPMLLKRLESKDCPDVLILPCLLVDRFGKKIRQHLPSTLQAVVLNFFPSYLFRRNVIGPPSCLIVRKKVYPIFDVKLHWLVDVDLYWRLFSSKIYWSYCADFSIASLQGRADSITNVLSNQMMQIESTERVFLSKKYLGCSIWLSPDLHKFIFFMEAALWGLFRALYLGASKILQILQAIFDCSTLKR